VFVPEAARFQRLLKLPEGSDIGKALNEAMKAIEGDNDELKDVLPKTYGRFDAQTLKELLKIFGTIPEDVEGDVFGRIYEYFFNDPPKTQRSNRQGAKAPRNSGAWRLGALAVHLSLGTWRPVDLKR